MTTTVTGTIKDVTGQPDNSAWVFYSVLREGDASDVVTSKWVRSVPVAGALSVDLESGFCIVNAPNGQVYNITVPDSGTPDIWDLLAAAVAFPPGTSAAAVATAVQEYLTENPLTVPWTSITSKPAVIAAGADAATARTAISVMSSTEVTAAITAAVTALVNGAPGALDTLKELADALNDDASFSATVTAALAAKAPLASPTFTGTVAGITKAMVGLGSADNTADTAKAVLSATKLATARTVNGVSFDGTTNIVVADSAVVYLDSFAGSDDVKLGLAMTFAAGQAHIPAIVFPARDVTFNTGGLTPYNGMKLYGPTGSDGPKNLELGTNGAYVNHRVILNVGSDASALFNGASGTWYDVHVRNLAFQGGNTTSQFWHQPGGTLYAGGFHSLTFFGMNHIFGSPTSKALLTQVMLTGHWTVLAGYDTQFHIGGSDNDLWADGYLNIESAQTVGAGVYYIMFDGLQKSRVGYIYATAAAAGWKTLQLAGSGYGTNFHGGTYEGISGTPSTVELINISGGSWAFFGPACNYSGPSTSAIVQSGGELALYSPTYIRDPSTTATTAMLFQTAGVARIVNPVAGTSGENVYARWSDGTTTELYNENQIHSESFQSATSGQTFASTSFVSVSNFAQTLASPGTAAIWDVTIVLDVHSDSVSNPGTLQGSLTIDGSVIGAVLSVAYPTQGTRGTVTQQWQITGVAAGSHALDFLCTCASPGSYTTSTSSNIKVRRVM